MNSKDFTGIRSNMPLPDPATVGVPGDLGDLLDDYIESTESMLDEIENAALAYESGNDIDENSAIIRRALHKIKGESAMVGIEDMSDLCHQTEFAFEELNENRRPDMLLRFKDWASIAIHSMASQV